jgi:raffinose/stachyose/melibiose transport system substrate-binding protein
LVTAPGWSSGQGEKPAAGSAGPVVLSLLSWPNENDAILIEALAKAYTGLHPNVTFTPEVPPGVGTELDNFVKARLASGDMNDIFYYNSGSLFQSLNPSRTLVDLKGEPFIANIAESFLTTVSQGGGTYGVPVGYASAGGVLYNKKVYARRAQELERVRGQQRSDQGGRYSAGAPNVRRRLDLSVVRTGRLL